MSENFYARNHNFVVTHISEDEVALFDPKNPSNFYGLKGTALDIWNSVDKPSKASRIVARIKEKYQAPDDILSSQTKSFLNELVDEDILVVNDD